MLLHILLFFYFFCELIFGTRPFFNCILGMLANCFFLALLVISCKYHPEIFNLCYNLLIASYGPYLAYSNKEGVIPATLGSLMYPTYVLLCTGSLKHSLAQSFLQIYYLRYHYVHKVQEIFEELGPQEVSNMLVQAATRIILMAVTISPIIHVQLKHAYNKIYIAEKQKDEYEKQKNFLLSFSHELRNLLNSLIGNIKLAELEDSIPEKRKEFLLNAEVCGELLVHMVNNILDTGKLEVDDLEVTHSPVKIRNTMDKAWRICSELIKRKDLVGSMRIQNDIPKALSIDPYRLTQVFLNLVGNAIKFTDSGSISISVEWIRDQETVDAQCFEPFPFNDDDDEQEEGLFEQTQQLSLLNDKYVFLGNSCIGSGSLADTNKGILKLIVSDTGCGISKEDLERLFDKFTQVTLNLSKKKLGTGLGLAITKELCKRMDGDVRAFSKKGKGTSFIMCIPAKPVGLSERHININNADLLKYTARDKKLRVMIVDDDKFNHVILKSFFSRLNIEVVEIAENGREAYQKYMTRRNNNDYINIITMDLYMPEMNGKIAIEKIREFERSKKLKPSLVIIISGNCGESEIKECLNKNGKIQANAFLKKPTNIEEVAAVISNYFES